MGLGARKFLKYNNNFIDNQARPEGRATEAIFPGPPAREGPPNYIASLLCRESVEGSQEAVGRGPPDNFRTNMVFLYITDEDQIKFTKPYYTI